MNQVWPLAEDKIGLLKGSVKLVCFAPHPDPPFIDSNRPVDGDSTRDTGMKAILNMSPSSSVLLGLGSPSYHSSSIRFTKSPALGAILLPGPRGYPLVGNLFNSSPRL